MTRFPEAGTTAVYHTSEPIPSPQLGVAIPELVASTNVPVVFPLHTPAPTVKAVASLGLLFVGGVCEKEVV